jgi:very-short-patch-repair endonuclease
VIEVDGPIHDQQTENDAARSAFLEANGLRVLRFRNESVLKHPDKVLDDIQSFLAKEP